MNMEKLESIADHPAIDNFKWVRPDETKFTRTCEFYIRGVRYEVQWFVNYSNLYVGEMQILFDDIRIDGCWPNKFKENLGLLMNGQVAAIIPLIEYPNRNQGGQTQ